MREICSEASSYNNLEHHRARQQADIYSVCDFVKVDKEREAEEGGGKEEKESRGSASEGSRNRGVQN